MASECDGMKIVIPKSCLSVRFLAPMILQWTGDACRNPFGADGVAENIVRDVQHQLDTDELGSVDWDECHQAILDNISSYIAYLVGIFGGLKVYTHTETINLDDGGETYLVWVEFHVHGGTRKYQLEILIYTDGRTSKCDLHPAILPKDQWP